MMWLIQGLYWPRVFATHLIIGGFQEQAIGRYYLSRIHSQNNQTFCFLCNIVQ